MYLRLLYLKIDNKFDLYTWYAFRMFLAIVVMCFWKWLIWYDSDFVHIVQVYPTGEGAEYASWKGAFEKRRGGDPLNS